MEIARTNSFLHGLLTLFIGEGDRVADCTLGNGHDALFLARSIGEKGHLYGFDIQERAVAATRSRLLMEGVPEGRFTLFRESHHRVAERVPPGVAAVVYNLGYLPGGDRSVTTLAETTVPSLLASLELLRPGGVAAVTIYPGHEGGREEGGEVLRCAAGLDHGRFHALHLGYANLPKDPPSILLIQRTEPF